MDIQVILQIIGAIIAIVLGSTTITVGLITFFKTYIFGSLILEVEQKDKRFTIFLQEQIRSLVNDEFIKDQQKHNTKINEKLYKMQVKLIILEDLFVQLASQTGSTIYDNREKLRAIFVYLREMTPDIDNYLASVLLSSDYEKDKAEFIKSLVDRKDQINDIINRMSSDLSGNLYSRAQSINRDTSPPNERR